MTKLGLHKNPTFDELVKLVQTGGGKAIPFPNRKAAFWEQGFYNLKFTNDDLAPQAMADHAAHLQSGDQFPWQPPSSRPFAPDEENWDTESFVSAAETARSYASMRSFHIPRRDA